MTDDEITPAGGPTDEERQELWDAIAQHERDRALFWWLMLGLIFLAAILVAVF